MGIKERKYISDIVDMSKIRPGTLCMVYGGCGAGKSTWWQRDLLPAFPDIREDEMMVVTSRAMPLDQTVEESDGKIQRANVDDIIAALCAGEDDATEYLRQSSIQMMTYDKLIRLTYESNVESQRTLGNIKIFVLDEIHALFVDDGFIPGMKGLASWIRDRLFSSNDQIFIGLTATPEVFLHINEKFNKMPITPVVDEVLLPYKVKHVTCTDYVGALEMVCNGDLPGKSLMICNSKEQCSVASQVLKDSAIVIGTTNKLGKLKQGTLLPLTPSKRERVLEVMYQPYMDEVRKSIARERVFPESITIKNYLFDRYETRGINTLISTSTLREGFNLDEASGVKNVIVMSTYDWEIKQIVGRCRYDVENLVIVRPLYYPDGDNTYGYNQMCHEEYDAFISGKGFSWFKRIQNIVDCESSDINIKKEAIQYWESQSRYNALKNKVLFDAFISRADKFVTKDEAHPVLIHGKQMKLELCAIARKMNLFQNTKARDYTFNRIRTAWSNYGYRVWEGRIDQDGDRPRYTVLYSQKEE